MKFATVALVASTLSVLLTGSAAQDRMPPIPNDRMTEAQKKTAQELIAGPRGALEGPFVPLLRSPEFMSRLQKMGEYLRYNNSLGTKLNEFVILLTSRQWKQEYEWDIHAPLALKAGLEPGVMAAVRDGRRPEAMTEDEALVYDFCAELRQDQSVSDATYARTVKQFGEQAVIDMVGTAGYYSMLSMIMNVARTPAPSGDAPQLAPFPH